MALTRLQLFDLWLERTSPTTRRTTLIAFYQTLSGTLQTQLLAALRADLLVLLGTDSTRIGANKTSVDAEITEVTETT